MGTNVIKCFPAFESYITSPPVLSCEEMFEDETPLFCADDVFDDEPVPLELDVLDDDPL